MYLQNKILSRSRPAGRDLCVRFDALRAYATRQRCPAAPGDAGEVLLLLAVAATLCGTSSDKQTRLKLQR